MRRVRRRIVESGRAALGLALTWSCSSPTISTERAGLATVARATFAHVGFAAGPALFTDDTGHLVEERRYEPFGAPIDARVRTDAGYPVGAPDLVARDLNPLNQRTEATTGWSDHGARWMAPETGRWLTADPPVTGPDATFMAKPWALHPYQYVDQNPVAYWDPDGRSPATSDQLLRVAQELDRQGHGMDMFRAVQVVANGWQMVVTDGRRGAQKSDDALIGGATVKDAFDSVVRLARDAPIRRLAISDHGYPGVQTLLHDVLVDAGSSRHGAQIHPDLVRLAGKFTSDGVLVLKGCNVMADDATGQRERTTEALRGLSSKLGVEVRAGDQLGDVNDDEIRRGTVTACRGGRCVTAEGESNIPAAWKEK